MSNVLVIEDNDSDQTILKFLLKQFGYSADFTKNVFDADEKLNQFNYEIILLDWHLPKMTGIDYLRQLKSNQKKKNIPVVMISGRNETKDIKMALKEGISDYVLKPIDPAILKNKMNEILSKKKDQWAVTQVPAYLDERVGFFTTPFYLTAISEVDIFFESSNLLVENEIYQLNFGLLKDIGVDELNIKIIKTDINEFSNQQPKFKYTGKLVGLKEQVLVRIRLLCRTLNTQKMVSNV